MLGLVSTLFLLYRAEAFGPARSFSPRVAREIASSKVSGEELALAVDGSSKLQQAMAGLSEDEQYNVVLQGKLRVAKGRGAFEADAWPLLEEMRAKRKTVNQDTRALLVDAAAATDDVTVMDRSLTLAKRAGSKLGSYGAAQSQLKLPPTDPRRRQDMLSKLPELPADNRGAEAAAAIAVILTSFASFAWPIIGGEDAGNPVFIVLLVALAAAAADVFVGDGSNATGAGGLVAAGVARLFTRDATRECRCEAASFLTAYLLGLPTFALSPSVLEAVRAAELGDQAGGDLASAAGTQRLLIWLMAPVAAEAAEHRQLLVCMACP